MKKQATSVLAFLLGISLVTGCGNQNGGDTLTRTNGDVKSAQPNTVVSNLIESTNPSENAESTESDGNNGNAGNASGNGIASDSADGSGTINVLANIKNKYASAAVDSPNEFNEPIYNLANDYVFTFDCNADAFSSVHDNVFGVYTTIDFENPDKYIRNCASCYLENGKFIVEPATVDNFYDIPESTLTADTDTYGAWKTESDGTWGGLNKLYLVQKYDLQTGEKLAKPIITPFSIHHDIESTTVKQKIDSNNNYYLEWTPVNGASAYLVYQINDDAFHLVSKTTDTKTSADNFMGQLHSNMWSEIVNKELQENGYDTTTSEKITMNADLHNHKNSKFAVVAVKNGQTSGISNIVDSNELADLLPYQVADNNMEITINTVTDIPTYVNMTTVNDKTMQMVINYHGCTAKFEDESSTTFYLYPTVYRTDLSPFRITVHGMSYDDFKATCDQVGERQDQITAKMPGENVETNVNVPNVPGQEEETGTTQKIEENTGVDPTTPSEPTTPEEPTNQVEPTDPEEPQEPGEFVSPEEPTNQVEPTTPEEPTDQVEPSTPEEPTDQVEPTTPEEPTNQVEPSTPEEPATPSQVTTNSTNELMNEVANAVNTNLTMLQDQSGVSIDQVLFAQSPLEEWIAYCLIARSEYIPVPYSEFPEGADVEGTASKILSMYRQNPTSGVISDIKYSYDYETFLIEYADDTNDRLNKSVEELKKAMEVANTVAYGLGEYDCIVALNDYFCANASYDESSMSTEVDMNSLTQSFIDAHTPYGILCNNYGVCESYSEAMALAGRCAGLNVIIETGDLYGAGGHEWNRVSIDGNWCILDITNNDSELVPNGLCNITDSMATELLIPDKQAFLFDASAFTDSYEYYHVKGDYVESVTDLANKLKEQLNSDNVAHVRCGQGISEEDVTSVCQQLYNEGYNINEGYFVYNIAVLSK